ncbi:cupin domain-containing protein [Ottowia thiooxydans]|uniref:cupin domain-containing protein n=1 Tax=Ottowia thiooxydans TaxID=219182 RepID=UPI00042904CA|nr:cupin domain-containing protein [Ottowia thiooxydans]
MTTTGIAPDRFRQQLSALNAAPLWDVLATLVPPQPRSNAVPNVWRWAQLRPQLLAAGELISAEEAERRVLMLCNPGIVGRRQVTDTLYAGLQLIHPGESARAHRHSQSALRFVLEGEGGFTSVDGLRADMRRGDFIVTPSWKWHDHGNDGDGPVMWLDGLDVPLVSFLQAGFREEHEAVRFPARGSAEQVFHRYGNGLLPLERRDAGSTSPIFSYPYERTRESLEQLVSAGEIDEYRGAVVRYANPLNGDWAMPSIGAWMQCLPKRWKPLHTRSTDSVVLTVVEGTPTIEIDGEVPVLLQPNDVFVVPGWRRWRALAGDTEDAVIFAYSDRPVHEKLGLYREQLG